MIGHVVTAGDADYDELRKGAWSKRRSRNC
jgi:hypothetical protein